METWKIYQDQNDYQLFAHPCSNLAKKQSKLINADVNKSFTDTHKVKKYLSTQLSTITFNIYFLNLIQKGRIIMENRYILVSYDPNI